MCMLVPALMATYPPYIGRISEADWQLPEPKRAQCQRPGHASRQSLQISLHGAAHHLGAGEAEHFATHADEAHNHAAHGGLQPRR